MSQISWDLSPTLPLLDPAASTAASRPAEQESDFTEHLARAQSETDAPPATGPTAPEPRDQTAPDDPTEPVKSADENAESSEAAEQTASASAEDTAAEAEDAENPDEKTADDEEPSSDDESQEPGVPVALALLQAVVPVPLPAEKVAQTAPAEADAKQKSPAAAEKIAVTSITTMDGFQPSEALVTTAQPVAPASAEVAPEAPVQVALPVQTDTATLPATPAQVQPASTAKLPAIEPIAAVAKQVSETEAPAAATTAVDPALVQEQAEPVMAPPQIPSAEPSAAAAAPVAAEVQTTDSMAPPGRKKAASTAQTETTETVDSAKATAPETETAAVAAPAPTDPSIVETQIEQPEAEVSEAADATSQVSTDNGSTPTDSAAQSTASSNVSNNVNTSVGSNVGGAAGSVVGSTTVGGTGINSAADTAKTDKTEQGRQVDRARFAQRVSRAFEAVGQRNGTVRLKLSPPELGSLRVEIAVQQGVLSAHLEAETPAARNLLLESLPALRDRLAQQDIRVERFDVDLMDRRPGNGTEQPGGQAQSQRQSSEQSTNRREPRVERTASATAVDSRASQASGDTNHLNVII